MFMYMEKAALALHYQNEYREGVVSEQNRECLGFRADASWRTADFMSPVSGLIDAVLG